MATPGMNPTPPPGAGGAPPNAVGAAVSKQPDQTQALVKQLTAGVQAIAAFTKAIESVSPAAAADFKQALQSISSGISKLRGGGPSTGAGVGPTAAPGGVPAPGPQVAETPEAT